MMAKVAVAVRLSPETVAWADAYAKRRKVSRQSVLEQAVESFRVDCEGGVPDLPPRDDGLLGRQFYEEGALARVEAVRPRVSPTRLATARSAMADAMARQARLNEAKDRATAKPAPKRVARG